MTERFGISRRQALMAGGLLAAVPLFPAKRPAKKTSPMSSQNDWRWCYLCQGLWFAGNGTNGRCPAAGVGYGHLDNGSGNYTLTQGSGSGQDNWRWCDQCQGLWFAGNGTSGTCPAGGGHSESGSGDYFLPQDAPPPQISLAVAGPQTAYSFTGTGWAPLTSVVVTTNDIGPGNSSQPGGPYNCSVLIDGSFFGYVDYNTYTPGTLLVAYAVDSGAHQSAQSAPIWVPIGS